MLPTEAIIKLKEIQGRTDGDQEVWHCDADDVLCELLISLGCENVVNEWQEIPKWYA